MADFEISAAALRGKLETGFTALPLYWPNDPRDPIKTGGKDGWVYSELRVIDEGAVSLGADGQRTHRDTGEFEIFVYVPRGTLAGTAEAHAASIRTLYGVNSLIGQGVRVTRRTIGRGELVDGPDGRWWAVPVLIEWFADRTE